MAPPPLRTPDPAEAGAAKPLPYLGRGTGETGMLHPLSTDWKRCMPKSLAMDIQYSESGHPGGHP